MYEERRFGWWVWCCWIVGWVVAIGRQLGRRACKLTIVLIRSEGLTREKNEERREVEVWRFGRRVCGVEATIAVP